MKHLLIGSLSFIARVFSLQVRACVVTTHCPNCTEDSLTVSVVGTVTVIITDSDGVDTITCADAADVSMCDVSGLDQTSESGDVIKYFVKANENDGGNTGGYTADDLQSGALLVRWYNSAMI